MATKKILVIDDDPDILDNAKIVLEAEGFVVVTANSGSVGFEAFKQENPDMIFCDMMMESVDEGARVAGKIRETNKQIPIYLLSSIGNATSIAIDTNAMGFTGVLQKPFEPKVIIETAKKALNV